MLRSAHQAVIPIGRLGAGMVAPGWYLYTGSALGRGGLRGRLQHHLRPAARPHWHIDFLRRVCDVTAVWYVVGERRWEHDWAGLLAQQAEPAPCLGFGASDCHCIAHCFFLSAEPSPMQFAADAQRLYPDHPAIEQRTIKASERRGITNP
ncbi:GIY-YIG nuclease family protein [Caldilinea sp.]|uniref:GIY-YIG nuclease family protein n=1 Tax=Caldilinea sp. TaxID=2293560 RepID=UPI002CDDE503|nr:GIY-YIG nuclease family protein [Anaerolineales bacterium]HQY94119.1 GIY-YIG nuclease family protein [Caldilinea sp.]